LARRGGVDTQLILDVRTAQGRLSELGAPSQYSCTFSFGIGLACDRLDHYVGCMDNDFKEDFLRRGFLSNAVSNLVPAYRAESQDWFHLAADVSETLQAIAFNTTEQCHGTSFERETVAAFFPTANS
jgi:hypothetical protein